MKFGYMIAYVANVSETLLFWNKAFGISIRFLHESGAYGELETGETAIAFASHEMGQTNFPQGYVRSERSDKPLGMEFALVADDVESAYQRALKAGAEGLAVPQEKPWGQTVAYVTTPDGLLVEICSPMKSS